MTGIASASQGPDGETRSSDDPYPIGGSKVLPDYTVPLHALGQLNMTLKQQLGSASGKDVEVGIFAGLFDASLRIRVERPEWDEALWLAVFPMEVVAAALLAADTEHARLVEDGVR